MFPISMLALIALTIPGKLGATAAANAIYALQFHPFENR